MKRWLALVWILCCLTGCVQAEKGDWTQEEWQAVLDALASDEAEPVPENRRVPFRSAWMPAAEKNFANLLLLSSDSPDIEKNFGRASAILVCRVDLITGKTRLLSLPEDALVTLPEVPEAIPLRYVNCFGGAGLTARCVNEALGLRVSRFCALNIDAFMEIVDGLGGVTMTLPEEEAAALEMEKGSQKLNGEQALGYVKLRHTGDGSVRLRGLLSAVMRQTAESGSTSQALRLADLMLPAVDTNLTTSELLDLVFAIYNQPQSAFIEARGLMADSGILDYGMMVQSKTFLYGEE